LALRAKYREIEERRRRKEEEGKRGRGLLQRRGAKGAKDAEGGRLGV